MTFEPTLKEVRKKVTHLSWRKNFPGGGKTKCPGSEMGVCLVGSGDSKEATVARAE